jgi:hypothetical protein
VKGIDDDVDRDSVIGIAICYGLDLSGIEPTGSEIFRTLSEWP